MPEDEAEVAITLRINSKDDPAEPLSAIRGISRGMEGIEKQLRRLVGEARKRGRSWQEIADALGVSRQAAWEQYRHEAPDRRQVIAEVLGSLAGPGPPSDEARRRIRGEEAGAERRRRGR